MATTDNTRSAQSGSSAPWSAHFPARPRWVRGSLGAWQRPRWHLAGSPTGSGGSVESASEPRNKATALLDSLLSGCKTWTLYQCHIDWLESFHLRCPRSFGNLRWQGRIPTLKSWRGTKSLALSARSSGLSFAGSDSWSAWRLPESGALQPTEHGNLL